MECNNERLNVKVLIVEIIFVIIFKYPYTSFDGVAMGIFKRNKII